MKPSDLAITMGDAAGVGPEIIADLLRRKRFSPDLRLLIVGDPKVLKIQVPEISHLKEWPTDQRAALINPFPLSGVIPGKPSLLTAEAAFACLQTAAQLAVDRQVDGIVTAPVSKAWIQKIRPGFTGHTEYLAGETGSRHFSMMLLGKNIYTGEILRVALVTTHLSLEAVASKIVKGAVLDKLEILRKELPLLGIKNPRIAVCGLNPHAGEGGVLGNREQEEIVPAIMEAKKKGIRAEGPFPADTLFLPDTLKGFDAVLAMYHDQGLIPLKQVTGRKSVNVTLGLNIIRTSVDHGTAYDIAGKGMADSSSLTEAIELAREMVMHRRRT
ncbi:MAG: 4-hydroxythreonine-4-phosphate dehydrogenase PdxA [bacterium]